MGSNKLLNKKTQKLSQDLSDEQPTQAVGSQNSHENSLFANPAEQAQSSKQSVINNLLAQALREQERAAKDQKVAKKLAQAQGPTHEFMDILDPANLTNVSDSKRKIHEPVSDYGKKSKKFRFLPTTTFGLVAAAAMLGATIFGGAHIYNQGEVGKAIHAERTSPKNLKEVVIGSKITTESGQATITPQVSKLERLTKDSIDVKNIQAIKLSNFNDMLAYMDTLAVKTAATSNENWHMIQYGMQQGVINKEQGLKLLQDSKETNTQFLKNLQADKDDMIIFYQGARKGDDVFYKQTDMRAIMLKEMGGPGSENIVAETGLQKTLRWYKEYTSNPSYVDSKVGQNRLNINIALGQFAEKAKTFSYHQIATGVPSNYKSIKLDHSGEARELIGPNDKVSASKDAPDILSAYKAQVPKFNQDMREAQIQNAQKYDALANKALQIVEEFNKKAQDVAQEATNTSSKPKP